MRKVLILGLLLNNSSRAESPPHLIVETESPELPLPIQSGESLEPDITIIRQGKKTIQEFRRNGQLYMVKVIPVVGPAYYFIDTDGDGSMDVRGSDLDQGININQWKIFQWE